MAVLDKINKVVDGDQVNDDFFNETNALIFTNTLKLALSSSTILKQGTYAGTISGSTTAELVNGLYRPTGYTFDDYADNSFDLAKHTVTFGGGASLVSSSITETSGAATIIQVTSNGGSPDNVTTVQFLHNFNSASQAIFHVDFSATASDTGGNTNRGSNEVAAFTYGTITLDSTTTSDGSTPAVCSGEYYVILNAARTTASVYRNGSSVGAISLAGKSDDYFRIVCTSDRASGANVTNTIVLNDTRYVDTGMSSTTDYVYINDSVSLGSTMNTILALVTDTTTGGTTVVTQASFDGGTNWDTITREAMNRVTRTNSTLLLRVGYTYGAAGDDFSFTRLGYIYG